ncbi:unnamed protein product [Clonostachys rhizophaga]|uniref:Uncharacterized protein n=1 Tax=Clonostachys rhizophaga TaxID=160324 RepID=A0A9N9VN96_9HYPO|nr:unnamed protein product [Clonostachys rhizophaga]
MMLITSSRGLSASKYSSNSYCGDVTVMLTPSSGHCLQKVAYVLRSMYGFCTRMSDLSGGNPRSRRRAWVKRTFSPVFVEAGSTRMAESGTPRWRARRAKMTASGSSKRLAGREAGEVEVRGADGDAGVQAAEAEDGVGGRGGVGEAVVVVDEGCILGYLV